MAAGYDPRGIYRALIVEIADGIRNSVADGYVGMNRQLEAFLKGMDIGAKGDMQRVNRQVAAQARQAVVESYERNVEAVRRVPSYQRFNRRSGYLGRVVRRRDLVSADSQGVYFLPEDSLDKEAAHWRRLNFGAGDEAGGGYYAYPLRLFGQTLGDLSFDMGPSPAFSLPKGFFIQGGKAVVPNSSYRGQGSVGKFIPSRRSPYQPAITEGIRGRHFLEAGLEAISIGVEVGYADLMNEWIQRGGRKARAVTSVTG